MLGEKKKSRHAAAVTLLLLVLAAALMVPEAAFAISNPPYIGLSFDPQSTKPLNILAGGSATFNMATGAFDPADLEKWVDGNISLSIARAPSWANVTITPNLFTGITKGDYYNSTMTLKIAQDAPEGLTSIVVHANAILIDGLRRSYSLEDTQKITLNIIAIPVRTITVTTTLSQYELPPRTVTTTVSTALTNTVTNTSTEQVSDPSTYAWAVSATVAAVVLAVILLLRRKNH